MTRQSHTRSQVTAYHAGAQALVCCSRGLGLLASPDGVESQRPETTKVFHKNTFLVGDHLRDITRHHVIIVTKLSSSAQVGHLCAGWPAACNAAGALA
eukprot:3216764-Prymnesium_polylepis.1